jgi:hypothetical protein
VFPQKAQMEITPGFFLVCIFCGLLFVPLREPGRARVKEDKPLPSLSVRVPTLSPHAVSWVGPED